MNSSRKILVKALNEKQSERIPFWFMRQAGRFLPEYRELRSRAKDFLEFCYTPSMAVEATLQPVKRFGMDAAIIFSDILVVPHALGVELKFEEGTGPLLTPVTTKEQLKKLKLKDFEKKLAPVYEALAQTKAKLSPQTALIGFVGAPWTLACYIIDGHSKNGFVEAKAAAERDDAFFSELMKLLTDAVIRHAKAQIKAGADVIQLFDSWAGILNEPLYRKWVMAPAREIVQALKSEFPDTPLIGFPRQSGSRYLAYAQETKIDAVSIDNTVPLEWVRDSLQKHCTVQGCLDPEILAGDKNRMLIEAQKIIDVLSDKVFVFNLGHGILPHTPVENMQALCDFLRNKT